MTDGPMKTLVAGDEPSMLSAITRLLEKAGHEVNFTSNAEEALDRQTALLRTVVDALPHPFLVLDPTDRRVLMANVAAYGGQPPEDLACHELNHGLPSPCDCDDQPCPLRQVLATRTPVTVEHVHRDKDGQPRHVEVHCAPVLDADGEVTNVVELVIDVTERRQVEEELRRYAEELEQLNATMVDRELRMIELKEQLNAVTRELGHPTAYQEVWKDEGSGGPGGGEGRSGRLASRGEQARPDEQERRVDVADETLQQGPSGGDHAQGRIASPSTIARSISQLRRIEHEQRQRAEGLAAANEALESSRRAALSVMQDLTAQRQAADQARADLHSVLDTAADGIITIDERGRIERFNAAAESIFGYAAGEVLGRGVSMLMPPPYSNEHDGHMQRFLRTGESRIIGIGRETEARRKDGSVFPIDLAVSESTAVGEGRRFTGIVRDISDRKRFEQELEQARDAAETASREKSEFLANVSHEIRTPLNGVTGMLELILGARLPQREKELARLALRSAQSLTAVLNDILDLSKIEAGKLDLEERPFELRSCVEEAAVSVAAQAFDKGLELICEIASDAPLWLRGDPQRLRQVLLNLLDNAVKLTDQGEVSIKLQVEAEEEDRVCLHFAVSDTGIGIPDDQQERIFKAFVQADGSTTRRHGGTGLGLSICSQLVKMMHGRMWLESKVGTGSTFYFSAWFPRPVKETEPRPWRDASLAGLPALVVDDNATNRRLLEELLRSWGLRPQTAASGAAALATAEQAREAGAPFALALIDHQMPEMDGLELVERLGQDPDDKRMEVIMLSSMGNGAAGRAHRPDISAWLTKPVRQSPLLETIQVVMGAGPAPEPSEPRQPLRSGLRVLVAEDNEINQVVVTGALADAGHAVVVASTAPSCAGTSASEPSSPQCTSSCSPRLAARPRWPRALPPGQTTT